LNSIFNQSDRAELERRLGTLTVDSPSQWGRMTPHQAVCHLNDWLKASLGDRPQPDHATTLKTRIIRFVAFTIPMPWPHGVKTSAGLDAEQGGTRPGDFDQDVADLRDLVRRFVETDGRGLGRHYKWGDMSRGEWGRYGYRHMNHHLGQFGV